MFYTISLIKHTVLRNGIKKKTGMTTSGEIKKQKNNNDHYLQNTLLLMIFNHEIYLIGQNNDCPKGTKISERDENLGRHETLRPTRI